VFGVILIIIIFLLPNGARQLAYLAQGLIGKLRKH
jgi:branched-chain amino acid transport system permease protein